jgi:predicted transport protein
MALFRIINSKVTKLLATEINLERTLQKLFEDNLDDILNVTFLTSEYSTSFGGRIDTLGIDKNGAPVIIEYKKRMDDNVINQGLSYLRWLLDHKADFEILCKSRSIPRTIDWNSPRVICIAESYNKFDLDTADILPINIELLRYRVYDKNILYVEPENYQKIKITTTGIIKKAKQLRERKEQLPKIYSLDEHLALGTSVVKQIFLKLREKITSLDESIIEEPKAKYIAYKTSTNFVDVVLLHKGIKVFLNVKSGMLTDSNKIARDLTKPKIVGHWGNGDYEVKLEKLDDIDKVFELIKQSYNYNK